MSGLIGNCLIISIKEKVEKKLLARNAGIVKQGIGCSHPMISVSQNINRPLTGQGFSGSSSGQIVSKHSLPIEHRNGKFHAKLYGKYKYLIYRWLHFKWAQNDNPDTWTEYPK